MGLYIFGWVYPTSFGHFGVQWQVCPYTSGSKAPTGDLYATDCEKWRRRKRIYSKSRHGLMGWMYSNIPSKKAQMHPLWRTLTTWQIFMGTNSPYNRLSCGQILDMTDYPWEMWRKFVMWRKNVSNLWCFVAFYAVLLQNPDLRSFVAIYALLRGEKFSQELRPVEKNDLY